MRARAPSRHLLDDSRDVTNGNELIAALRDSVRDIRITTHIDLSTEPIDPSVDQARGSRTLPDVASPTTTLRGDCAEPPDDATVQRWNLTQFATLLERRPRQCFVVCDTDCMTVTGDAVWMDSIYLRFKRTTRSDSSTNESRETQVPQLLTVSGLGSLYMSNVTLQGDGQPDRRDATQAIFLPDVSSSVFSEDMIVDHVGGKSTSAIDVFGSASFLNSTFQNIRISNAKEYAVVYVWQRAHMMLRDPIFSNNSARFDVGKNKNGLVYLRPEQAADIDVKPLDVTFNDYLEYDDLVLDTSNAPPDAFLSEEDIFYRRSRGTYLDFVTPPKADGEGLSTAAIIGITVACAIAILSFCAICAMLALLRSRRRAGKRRGTRSYASSDCSADMEPLRRPPSPGRGKSPFSSAAFLSHDGSGRERHDLAQLTDATRTSSTLSTTKSHITANLSQAVGGQGGDMKAPGADAPIKQRLAWVHWQLDQFNDQHLLLDRFHSLGPTARRQGGQAVVQFARNMLDQREYALKVFAVPHAYHAEAAMYQDEDMTNFLPRVEAMHDGSDTTLVDPSGNILPPIIIMEKGESLNEWSARAEPDLFMAIAVLANVALRLAEFHAAGYVHRDVKPANVMWLPRENRWTVIDFGCTGRVGDTVPLSFTLVYAAPEVIGALKEGEKTIKADPALDTWALGVMAFELLSGEPAFHVLSDGKDEVIAQLTGEKKLPWEERGPAAAERLESLGVFKGAILQLLNRDPAQRPSMQRFYDAANRIFSSRTTIKI